MSGKSGTFYHKNRKICIFCRSVVAALAFFRENLSGKSGIGPPPPTYNNGGARMHTIIRNAYINLGDDMTLGDISATVTLTFRMHATYMKNLGPKSKFCFLRNLLTGLAEVVLKS